MSQKDHFTCTSVLIQEPQEVSAYSMSADVRYLVSVQDGEGCLCRYFQIFVWYHCCDGSLASQMSKKNIRKSQAGKQAVPVFTGSASSSFTKSNLSHLDHTSLACGNLLYPSFSTFLWVCSFLNHIPTMPSFVGHTPQLTCRLNHLSCEQD